MANTVLWWSTLMSVKMRSKAQLREGAIFDYSRVDWVTPTCLLLLGVTAFSSSTLQIYSGGSQWKMQLVWLTAGAMAYLGVAGQLQGTSR